MATALAAAASAGFAPDSVYAESTIEERAICDRLEEETNDRRSWLLALRDERENHSVRGTTDAGLKRLAKAYRREIEDIDDGELGGSKGRRRLAVTRLRDVEQEQEFRATLADTWQATEDGTHDYTSFQGRGGLLAVLDHGATPPSYDLAIKLDWEQFALGKVHVLDWSEAA